MDPGTGIGVAMAGRLTPLMRPIRRSAAAMVAPVLPAETIADALPSRTASAARTRVESFLRRTPFAASSCISMTSDATIRSRSPRPSRSSGPTSTTGMPSAAAACAPARISLGARSPPIASTAIGNIESVWISRRRWRRGLCTNRTPGTPCVAAWRRHSVGTHCATVPRASMRRHDGSATSSSTFSSLERPQQSSLTKRATRG